MNEMFLALVLACTPVKEIGCMQITDTRGPYATRRECVERTGEMIRDSLVLFRTQRPQIHTNFYNFKYRCDVQKLKGVSL
jgi:hypothetical protein